MTVPATDRIAGPFNGNDATTAFPFTNFKVLDQGLFEVYHVSAAGAETKLTASVDYTIVFNADQDAAPGGTITYPVSGDPLATGEQLYGKRVTSPLQEVDIVTQGSWDPNVVETMVDRSRMREQELDEEMARTVKVSVSSGTDPDALVNSIFVAATAADASATAAAAALTEFQGQYYGPLASDPTLDPNGNAPTNGDLYYDTVTSYFKVFNGTTWDLPASMVNVGTADSEVPLNSNLGELAYLNEAYVAAELTAYARNNQLGVVGFDFSNLDNHIALNYPDKTFIYSAQTATTEDSDVAANGEWLFILSTSGTLFAYDIADFDAASAAYTGNSFSFTTQNTTVVAVRFSYDGTKCYMLGTTGADTVYQYTLTTPWDITTISYATKSVSVDAQLTGSGGNSICFSLDGTKMYIVDGATGSDTIYQYTLSTAWDVSTASYDSKSKYVGAENTLPEGSWISSDGTQFMLVNVGDNIIQRYTLSTAFDISTATLDTSIVHSTFYTGITPIGLSFSPDGKQMIISSAGNSDITTVDLATPYDIHYSYIYGKGLGVSGWGDSAFVISHDGKKAYVISSAETIYEFNLVVPNDVHSAVYSGNSLDVSTQDSSAQGLELSRDGRHIYLMGGATDTVYQYDMSVAWDLSTAVYNTKNLSVTTQAATPVEVVLSRDGTKAYVLDSTTDTIYQYTLSTAWDISTGTYATKSLGVTAQDTSPSSFTMNAAGTRLYYIGTTNDNVHQYNLGTAWDLATAVFSATVASLGGLDSNPNSLCFNNDGAFLYYQGGNGSIVFQLPTNVAVLL